MSDWSLLPPRPDVKRPFKLAMARQYLTAGHHRKIPADVATARQIRNYRLKQPWMTVCTGNSAGSVAFYFNGPARRVIFANRLNLKRTLTVIGTVYATYEPHTEVLRLLHKRGGQPLVLAGDNKVYSHAVASELIAAGKASEHEALYYPVVLTFTGAAADLERSYTKRDAMKKEEDDRCLSRSRRDS